MIQEGGRTCYWYEDECVKIHTEDIDDIYDCLGTPSHHNIKVIALAAQSHKPFYFANTRHDNIIARSDGMFRDFGSKTLIMYPAGYDFDAVYKYDDLFPTSTLEALWQDIEIC